MNPDEKHSSRNAWLTAIGCTLAAYLFSYMVWINYTSTGNYFDDVFGPHGIHSGMSFAAHPSPRFLQDLYWPLMWLDVLCGRLVIFVG